MSARANAAANSRQHSQCSKLHFQTQAIIPQKKRSRIIFMRIREYHMKWREDVAITRGLFSSFSPCRKNDSRGQDGVSQSPEGSSHHFHAIMVIATMVAGTVSQSPEGSSHHFHILFSTNEKQWRRLSQSPEGSSHHFHSKPNFHPKSDTLTTPIRAPHFLPGPNRHLIPHFRLILTPLNQHYTIITET